MPPFDYPLPVPRREVKKSNKKRKVLNLAKAILMDNYFFNEEVGDVWDESRQATRDACLKRATKMIEYMETL
jgi:AmiR/NasT family two-component response regulator